MSHISGISYKKNAAEKVYFLLHTFLEFSNSKISFVKTFFS